MMQLSKLLVLICVFVGFNNAIAQPCALVTYTYDACGNRIKRSLQVQPCNYNQSSRPSNPDNKKDSLPEEDPIITKEIKIYPNPTAESVFIEWENDSLSYLKNIILFDITGKQIREVSVGESDLQFILDLSSQKNGIYTVELIFTDNKRRSYKVLKN